jgi:hypothetical protein
LDQKPERIYGLSGTANGTVDMLCLYSMGHDSSELRWDVYRTASDDSGNMTSEHVAYKSFGSVIGNISDAVLHPNGYWLVSTETDVVGIDWAGRFWTVYSAYKELGTYVVPAYIQSMDVSVDGLVVLVLKGQKTTAREWNLTHHGLSTWIDIIDPAAVPIDEGTRPCGRSVWRSAEVNDLFKIVCATVCAVTHRLLVVQLTWDDRMVLVEM